MDYKQAKALADKLCRWMHQLLRLGNYGDIAITTKYTDEPYLKKRDGGYEQQGECIVSVPYMEAHLTFALRVTEIELCRAVIHEHVHVAFAEIRRLAEATMDAAAFNRYDDAEERAVVRLTRAFHSLYVERQHGN